MLDRMIGGGGIRRRIMLTLRGKKADKVRLDGELPLQTCGGLLCPQGSWHFWKEDKLWVK
jgi:hypothetical protein